MPNFDGTGPLKRGRLIGRGRGVCMQNASGCRKRDMNPKSPETEEADEV
jgi:hypothetical protein